MEARQGSENGVEVVGRQVVEEQMELRRGAAELKALVLHRLLDFEGGEQGVGARGAAQLGDRHALGEEGGVEFRDGVLSDGSRLRHYDSLRNINIERELIN